jgi:hypothetical protein
VHQLAPAVASDLVVVGAPGLGPPGARLPRGGGAGSASVCVRARLAACAGIWVAGLRCLAFSHSGAAVGFELALGTDPELLCFGDRARPGSLGLLRPVESSLDRIWNG